MSVLTWLSLNPAWVEAIGTVCAVFVSIWVSNRQATQNRAERAQDRLDDQQRQDMAARETARKEDAAEKEEFEKNIRFLRFVRDKIESTNSRLKAIIEAASPHLRHRNDPTVLARIVRETYDEFASMVVRPLKRVGELPVTYWPDPALADEFQQGLFYVEADLRSLDEVMRVQVVMSAEGQGDRLALLVDKLRRCAQLFEDRFALFNRIAEDYFDYGLNVHGIGYSSEDRYRFQEDMADRARVIERELKEKIEFEELHDEYNLLSELLPPDVPTDEELEEIRREIGKDEEQ